MQKQLALKLKERPSHGGRRKGAGRKNRSKQKAHVARPEFSDRHPLHVTLRLQNGLPSLRRKDVFRSLRHAVAKARRRGLRVVHFSVLSNHIHLLVEAPDKRGLAKVMQSFALSFAKSLNALRNATGAVFFGRYDLHVLKTPTEVRNALRYVLLNESLHERKNGTQKALRVQIGPFSNAWNFSAWKELTIQSKERVTFEDTLWPEDKLESWLAEMTTSPQTWLLRAGWMRAKNKA